VLVTHRLESVVDCDQIYVMDAGRIVEHGRHAVLLAQRGRYTRLWQRVEAPDKPPRPVAALA
jgi:ABC-type multidrug transport system fused ATPase/permease subunit